MEINSPKLMRKLGKGIRKAFGGVGTRKFPAVQMIFKKELLLGSVHCSSLGRMSINNERPMVRLTSIRL